ncbi:MAG: NAD-dependent epimerase/dehydratase family protein [Burkholderiales bacterium]
MANILITGAGLVGCNVARVLLSRGHQAVLFDRSPNQVYIDSVVPGVPVVSAEVQDLATVIDTLQSHHIETIVHTAYLIGGSLRQRPYGGMRANIDGCLVLIEAARLCKLRRFVFTSTFGIYDWNQLPQAPITEDFPVAGDNPYIACKIASEKLISSLAKAYQLEFAILRLAQIYGRGHYLGGDFAGAAMHQALSAATAGNTVRLDPGVLTMNDYVYVNDVAEGVALACEKPLRHSLYNIGSGLLGSTHNVAAAIAAAFPSVKVDIHAAPIVGPFWRHEQILDLSRSRQDLGFSPQYDLRAGIGDFVLDLSRCRE